MSDFRQHTPGPWRVDSRFGHPTVWATTAKGLMQICDVRGWGHLIGIGAMALKEEDAITIQDANTRLIAAAPDLLEALNKIFLSDKCPNGSGCGCPLCIARDAIARVEGQI